MDVKKLLQIINEATITLKGLARDGNGHRFETDARVTVPYGIWACRQPTGNGRDVLVDYTDPRGRDQKRVEGKFLANDIIHLQKMEILGLLKNGADEKLALLSLPHDIYARIPETMKKDNNAGIPRGTMAEQYVSVLLAAGVTEKVSRGLLPEHIWRKTR